MTLRTRMACVVILILLGCVFAAPYYQKSASTNHTPNEISLPTLHIQVGRSDEPSPQETLTESPAPSAPTIVADTRSVLKKSTTLRSSSRYSQPTSSSFDVSSFKDSSSVAPQVNGDGPTSHRFSASKRSFAAAPIGATDSRRQYTTGSRFKSVPSTLNDGVREIEAPHFDRDEAETQSNGPVFGKSIPEFAIPVSTNSSLVQPAVSNPSTKSRSQSRFKAAPVQWPDSARANTRQAHATEVRENSRPVSAVYKPVQRSAQPSRYSSPRFEQPPITPSSEGLRSDPERRLPNRFEPKAMPVQSSASRREATPVDPSSNKSVPSVSAPPSRFESQAINWNRPPRGVASPNAVREYPESRKPAESSDSLTFQPKRFATALSSTSEPFRRELTGQQPKFRVADDQAFSSRVGGRQVAGNSVPPSANTLVRSDDMRFARPAVGNVASSRNQPQAQSQRWHRISRYDNLAEISQKYYGTSEYALYIFEANRRSLVNPRALPIGLELVIPDLPPAYSGR